MKMKTKLGVGGSCNASEGVGLDALYIRVWTHPTLPHSAMEWIEPHSAIRPIGAHDAASA